jgi:hypothetical protein
VVYARDQQGDGRRRARWEILWTVEELIPYMFCYLVLINDEGSTSSREMNRHSAGNEIEKSTSSTGVF